MWVVGPGPFPAATSTTAGRPIPLDLDVLVARAWPEVRSDTILLDAAQTPISTYPVGSVRNREGIARESPLLSAWVSRHVKDYLPVRPSAPLVEDTYSLLLSPGLRAPSGGNRIRR